MPIYENQTLISGEGLLAENFCDVTLTGIAWQADGVVLDLEFADTKLLGSTTARLVSRWPRSAVVTLDLSKKPGPPLTWKGKVTRSLAGGFQLVLDFASNGDIAIECHAFDALIASLAARAAWRGLTLRPPADKMHLARVEGWIAVPRKGSLGDLPLVAEEDPG